jgi:hypothetical protein
VARTRVRSVRSKTGLFDSTIEEEEEEEGFFEEGFIPSGNGRGCGNLCSYVAPGGE